VIQQQVGISRLAVGTNPAAQRQQVFGQATVVAAGVAVAIRAAGVAGVASFSRSRGSRRGLLFGSWRGRRCILLVIAVVFVLTEGGLLQ